MRKNYISISSLCLLIILGCQRAEKDVYNDFDHTIYSPRYSIGFDIKSDKDSLNHIISVYNPWQGAKNVTTALMLSPRNKESIPATETLNGVANRIVCMSSTHVAMLEALGATDKIVAVSGKQYLTNDSLRESYIPDIGYEGNIDYETLLSVKPDLVLLFSVNGASSMEAKLKELNIPYVYIGDYTEENPLGKTEWIVALAEIIGQREKGINIFNEIEHRYNSLVNLVKNHNQVKPKVMVNAPFADFWYMPSTESYIARIISEAGGDYIYKKNTGNASLPIDMEEALQLVGHSDIWINIGAFNSKMEVINSFPKFKDLKCVRNGSLYNNNRLSSPGGGNDCYESGVVNPDLILSDLIKIFHPGLINQEFTYYHKLE